MLLTWTLLFIGVISGLSSLHSIVFGWGDDTVPDKAADPAGHASGNRFGLFLSGALLVGALISAMLGY